MRYRCNRNTKSSIGNNNNNNNSTNKGEVVVAAGAAVAALLVVAKVLHSSNVTHCIDLPKTIHDKLFLYLFSVFKESSNKMKCDDGNKFKNHANAGRICLKLT
jgi:hypothetical protein